MNYMFCVFYSSVNYHLFVVCTSALLLDYDYIVATIEGYLNIGYVGTEY